MCSKIRCDGESENFSKIFLHLNGAWEGIGSLDPAGPDRTGSGTSTRYYREGQGLRGKGRAGTLSAAPPPSLAVPLHPLALALALPLIRGRRARRTLSRLAPALPPTARGAGTVALILPVPAL
jgi:hypothetical protein